MRKIIWLVNPYGPIEGEKWRDYSFNQFGKYLSLRGYDVIWWTSNFAHHFKKFRSDSWSDIHINDHYVIRLVPTCGYQKNISIGRFKKDYIFGKESLKKFDKSAKPDLIIEYLDPLTMGSPTYKYAKKHSIPVIIDQMDVWPEFIEKQAPKHIRPILHLMLQPIYKRRASVYKNASGYMALGKHYLEFAQSIAPYSTKKPSALVYNGIDTGFFRSKMSGKLPPKLNNIMRNTGEVWFVFAGTFGPSYDVNNIIQCAERAEKEKLKAKFIFAGSGPLAGNILRAEEMLSNIVYLGSLLPEQLIPVYAKCDVGLATYSAGSNVDVPDKFYDYTAAGLAVINSLTGEVHEFINTYKVGINYEGGNGDSLYNGIITMVFNKEKLSEMKSNSWKLGELFDANVQNNNLLELVKKITG